MGHTPLKFAKLLKEFAESPKSCSCGNPEFGFDCICDWVRANPGNIEYDCEFCGMYTASKPRCNKCQQET